MHKASLLFIFEPCQGSKVRCLRSGPRLFRPAFPFSWCIRYKQKDDYTFLQPSLLTYYLSTVRFYQHI